MSAPKPSRPPRYTTVHGIPCEFLLLRTPGDREPRADPQRPEPRRAGIDRRAG